MEIIILLGTILQGAAISLGMGASTLAIVNFFVAIADGKIEPDERKMMGVVYVVLRVAMVMILTTFVLLLGAQYIVSGVVAINFALLTLISVLFINAILMTKRIMPSTVGPALQASTWYTQGIMTAAVPLGYVLSYGQFLLAYMTMFVLAVSIVNGIMAYLKK
ncbi:hypothetical protein K2P47_00200 [Patescibacteria group bacterium]|nr:hypothetical protein [Patescibacteria group bacterium]